MNGNHPRFLAPTSRVNFRLVAIWSPKNGPEGPFLVYKVVAHTGFEPVISALRGRRPGPLDECALVWLRGQDSNLD